LNSKIGQLFVISAPSGAGKSSLIQKIINNFENIELSISATTRSPRKGEVDGKHYFFVTENEFNSMKEDDAFIEYALVHNYQYGTLRKYIDEKLSKGINVICDIDVQGFKLIQRDGIDHTSIFIIPPSIEELEKRLLKRGLDSENVIGTRLKNAKEELKYAEEFNFRVLNDNLDQAYKEIVNIIINGKLIKNKDKIYIKLLRDMLS
jgi:guanylate kinase|tara:strand:+ start:2162 stop:2779 length:618 start_codon:yes stop_codon:yes gene_type:complete